MERFKSSADREPFSSALKSFLQEGQNNQHSISPTVRKPFYSHNLVTIFMFKLEKEKGKKKQNREGKFLHKRLGFIWTGFNEPPPSIKCRPLRWSRRSDMRRCHRFQVCFGGGKKREAGVLLLRSVREVSKWLPWSAHCPLRSTKKGGGGALLNTSRCASQAVWMEGRTTVTSIS